MPHTYPGFDADIGFITSHHIGGYAGRRQLKLRINERRLAKVMATLTWLRTFIGFTRFFDFSISAAARRSVGRAVKRLHVSTTFGSAGVAETRAITERDIRNNHSEGQ